MNKASISILGAVVLGAVLIFSLGVIPSPQDINGNSLTALLPYESLVCVSTTGDFEGRTTDAHSGIVETIGCGHNTLYDTGADEITSYLFDAGYTGNFNTIELCNSSFVGSDCGVPTAGKTEGYTAYFDSGLAETNGTVLDIGNGNRSVSYTFTANASEVATNTTRLKNWAGVDLAGVQFTTATLQGASSDTLFINWSVWISD